MDSLTGSNVDPCASNFQGTSQESTTEEVACDTDTRPVSYNIFQRSKSLKS